MTTETEEFEFRHRLEAEKPAAPAASQKNAAADAVKKGRAQAAAEEENPNLVAVGRAAAAPIEGLTQLLSPRGHQKGKALDADAAGRKEAMTELETEHPMTRLAGASTDVGLGALGPVLGGAKTALGRILQGGATGGAYGAAQPVTGGSFGTEKAKQVAGGAAAGSTLTGAVESMIPGPLRTFLGKLFSPEAPKAAGVAAKPAGQGAEAAVGELQRQRDVQEGRADPQWGGAPSDTAKVEFEGRTQALKDKAFGSNAKIDTAPTGKLIDELLTKNPDKQVQGALKEVKATIERATKGAQSAALPAAGARMSPADLKALQGQGSKLDMGMADEVRQTINRLINQSGDKALSGHTKELLTKVRDGMLKDAPPEYKEWLATEASGRKALDEFKPEQSVLGKTTSADRAFKELTGSDAQKKMEGIFTGDRQNRDLTEAVAWTKHNPQALDGLRTSYKEWLFPVGPNGTVNINAAAKNWHESRDAVKNSGLFEPKHYEAVDRVVNDMVGAKAANKANEQAATVAGYFVGLPLFHPGRTAVAAKELVSRDVSKTPSQVEDAIAKALMDPEKAALLAEAPTPLNISRVEKFLAVAGSRAESKNDAKPKKPVPDVFSMRPAGI